MRADFSWTPPHSEISRDLHPSLVAAVDCGWRAHRETLGTGMFRCVPVSRGRGRQLLAVPTPSQLLNNLPRLIWRTVHIVPICIPKSNFVWWGRSGAHWTPNFGWSFFDILTFFFSKCAPSYLTHRVALGHAFRLWQIQVEMNISC